MRIFASEYRNDAEKISYRIERIEKLMKTNDDIRREDLL